MPGWTIEIPKLSGAVATLVPAPSEEARKQEFWVSTIAGPSDPFFDVTSSVDKIVVAARERD